MPTIDIKLNIKFLLAEDANKIKLKDNTVLTPSAPYKAGVSIKSPSGIFYNNVDYLVSPNFNQSIKDFTINIPKNNDGTLLQGTYEVVYTIDDLQGQILTKTYTIVFRYTQPVPTLQTNIDISQPLMVSVDTTSYKVNNIEPSLIRRLAIYYPSTTGKPETVSTSDNVVTNEFYHTGLIPLQHEIKLTSYLTYDFSSLSDPDLDPLTFIVEDYISLIEPINVVNPLDENYLYQTLSNMYQAYQSYQGKDYNRTMELKGRWEEACAYVDMIEIAIKSGNGQDVECYTKKLLALGQACECVNELKYERPQIVYGASGKLGAILNGELPMPSDGKDGTDGQDGIDGTDGQDGTNGQDGVDGTNGQDGVDGTDGQDGTDGISVTKAELDANSDLIITFSDGSTQNAGSVNPSSQRYYQIARSSKYPQNWDESPHNGVGYPSDTLAFWQLITESVQASDPTYIPQVGDQVLITQDIYDNGHTVGLYERTLFSDDLTYDVDNRPRGEALEYSNLPIAEPFFDLKDVTQNLYAFGWKLKTVNKPCLDFKFAFQENYPNSTNSVLAVFTEKGLALKGKWNLPEQTYANLPRDIRGDVIIGQLDNENEANDNSPIAFPKLYWDGAIGYSSETYGNGRHQAFKVPMYYEINQLTNDEMMFYGNVYVKSLPNEPNTLYLAIPDQYGDALTRFDATLTIYLDGVDIVLNTRFNQFTVRS